MIDYEDMLASYQRHKEYHEEASKQLGDLWKDYSQHYQRYWRGRWSALWIKEGDFRICQGRPPHAQYDDPTSFGPDGFSYDKRAASVAAKTATEAMLKLADAGFFDIYTGGFEENDL